MKKQILMLSAVAMIMIASCSKSKDEPKEETVSCQITEKTSTNGKTTYIYDSNGKLIEVKYDEGYRETYVYSPTMMVWSFMEIGENIDDDPTTFHLDAQGRVRSASHDAGNETFSYNNDGYLIEVRENNRWNVGTTKFTWSNGNLTKIERTRSLNGQVQTYTDNIEYSAETRPSNFVEDVTAIIGSSSWFDGDRQLLSGGLFGKMPKNLTSQYYYENDNNGNVIKATYVSTSNTEVINLKYICK